MMSNTEKPGGLSALLRNPAVALPVAAAVGGFIVALVLEGPKLIAHALTDPARIIAENRAETVKAKLDLSVLSIGSGPPQGMQQDPIAEERQRKAQERLRCLAQHRTDCP